jgi:hypothetical protein
MHMQRALASAYATDRLSQHQVARRQQRGVMLLVNDDIEAD